MITKLIFLAIGIAVGLVISAVYRHTTYGQLWVSGDTLQLGLNDRKIFDDPTVDTVHLRVIRIKNMGSYEEAK